MTKTTTAPAYSVERIDGHGFNMNTMRGGPTVCFQVKHADGAVAFSTATWMVDGVTPRQIQGLRLQASRALPRYESYLGRTGKRWEVEQKEQKDAARAAKKKADRIKYLTKTIPAYEAELAELLKA